MNKITLCSIAGLGGFIGGIVVSKILVKRACEELIDRIDQKSVKYNNDFIHYWDRNKFKNKI